MDVTKERVWAILYESIRDLNEQRSKHHQLACLPNTRVGDGAALDSLGFVNFIALVEEKCDEVFGKCIVLTENGDEHASSDPFETLESLARFIECKLHDRRASWELTDKQRDEAMSD